LIVNVILNLAAFFAYHVFWPHGFQGRFDAVAALIGFCALLALLRYKAGVIPVIAICGLAGFLIIFINPG